MTAYGTIESAVEAMRLGAFDYIQKPFTEQELLVKVAKALGKAMAAYNRAVGSMESRVLPSARRFRDLGAATGEEIALLQPLDQAPRQLGGPDSPRQTGLAEDPTT